MGGDVLGVGHLIIRVGGYVLPLRWTFLSTCCGNKKKFLWQWESNRFYQILLPKDPNKKNCFNSKSRQQTFVLKRKDLDWIQYAICTQAKVIMTPMAIFATDNTTKSLWGWHRQPQGSTPFKPDALGGDLTRWAAWI